MTTLRLLAVFLAGCVVGGACVAAAYGATSRPGSTPITGWTQIEAPQATLPGQRGEPDGQAAAGQSAVGGASPSLPAAPSPESTSTVDASVPGNSPVPGRTANPVLATPNLAVTGWRTAVASFYGPGFYCVHPTRAGCVRDGSRVWLNGTACGQLYTTTIVGVAHRTLRCGTRVTFRYRGVVLTVPVIDRGPYVAGRLWDLSGGACTVLRHCFTGEIGWRLP